MGLHLQPQHCWVLECRRGIMWPQQQKCSVASAAAETASQSVAGQSSDSCNRMNSIQHRCRSVLWRVQRQKGRGGGASAILRSKSRKCCYSSSTNTVWRLVAVAALETASRGELNDEFPKAPKSIEEVRGPIRGGAEKERGSTTSA